MIDNLTAIQLISDTLKPGNEEYISVDEAHGRILARDIIASADHPFFDQSAVDGYAFYFADKDETLLLKGEVAAGAFSHVPLKQGEVSRIFTGAPLTGGADTVVMQEYVERIEQDGQTFISIHDKKLKQGGNVRRKGEQLKAGDVTLTKGSLLTASGIGFLASIGVRQVSVYNKATVGIIVSGNEFGDKDKALEPGKIYESNGVMLQSALSEQGIISNYDIAVDDQASLEKLIELKLTENDQLIITGGVSVGDYDFTRPALENLGFKAVFHKVRQKPGKPILFATRDDGKAVFGLPGNPRSAMICYYLYVLPGLLKVMGKTTQLPLAAELPLAQELRLKEDGKTHFVAARLFNGQVLIDRKQGSHMMLSMSLANLIAVFPEDKRTYQAGEKVLCHFITNQII